MAEKGKPKRDGSGKGRRLNQGRGGCNPPKNKNRRWINHKKLFIVIYYIGIAIGGSKLASVKDIITILMEKHKDNQDKIDVLVEFIELNWSEHTRAEFWPELFMKPKGIDQTLNEVHKEIFG